VRVTERVEKGVPHERIGEVVETLKPDIVVQGTHGSKGVEDRMIGGTAERIIRKTRCPVVSVKPVDFGPFLKRVWSAVGRLDGAVWAGPPPRESYRFPPGRILYATDFSEASRLAMAPALRIARLSDADLIVLHVVQEEGVEIPWIRRESPAAGSPKGSPEEQMEAWVREMNAYRKGLRISPRIVPGDAGSVIVSQAIREEVGLLVMGTRGLTGWDLVLNGSTADRAIHHAPCPVLTVRPNWKLERLGKKFRRVSRILSPADLQRMSSAYRATVEDDLLGSVGGMKKSELFLNYYSREGILTALREYGILDRLQKEGFEAFRVVLDLEDPFRHKMRLYHGGQERADHMLVELVAREGIVQIPDGPLGEALEPAQSAFSVLQIEWICLQNPGAAFSRDRPPLPGQDHPGLGIGYEIYQLLVYVGLRVKKEGLMNRPQHYHNAKLYHETFKFLDPVREGMLIALIRDTESFNLADVSWAVHHGCLLDGKTGQTVPWEGGMLICPLTEKLGRYFASRAYHDVVWETVANTHFRIDWEGFRRSMQAEERNRHERALSAPGPGFSVKPS